jgi:hypothetical protein
LEILFDISIEILNENNFDVLFFEKKNLNFEKIFKLKNSLE